jgi:hypothetical protein
MDGVVTYRRADVNTDRIRLPMSGVQLRNVVTPHYVSKHLRPAGVAAGMGNERPTKVSN